jgi:hypothetical protein
LDYVVTYTAETFDAREEANLMGFTSDEIEKLGFGYMLDIIEEE